MRDVALRWSAPIAAVAVAAWTLSAPAFRDGEGYLTGAVVVPIAVALSLAAFGFCARRGAVRLAGWLSFLLVGQAATLQLIEAGRQMRYQHFKPLPRMLGETHPVLIAILVVQLLVVAMALWRRRVALAAFVSNRLLSVPGLLALLAFVATSATVSHEVSFYFEELAVASLFQMLHLATALLAVAAIPDRLATSWSNTIDTWLGSDGGDSSWWRIDRFAVAAALWVTVVSATLCVLSYQRHPHIPDEVAYLIQAKFFASGVVTAPAPPVPEGFELYLMHVDGSRWYPSPPPGWPAILALGSRLGAAWLVNPLLGGICVLLAYLLLRSLYPLREARLGVALLCVSPWFLFMNMNFMTHTATLASALAAAVAVQQVRRTQSLGWAGAAGVALGIGSLIRPLDGLIAAVLVGLWAVGLGGRRLRVVELAVLVGVTGLVGAAVLPYNAHLTGDPLRFPINAYTDAFFGPGSNAYGFGPDRGMGWPIDPHRGHTPVDGLINANLNAFSINVELFGWCSGSLWLAIVAFFFGGYRRSEWLMLAVILGVAGAYFPYYFSGGPDFGARYWYLVIVPLVALSARGMDRVDALLGSAVRPGAGWGDGSIERSTPSALPRPGAVLIIAALTFASVTLYLPWRAADKYFRYLGMQPGAEQLVERLDATGDLILIRGEAHPDYASVAFLNPVDLASPGTTIYAWDRGPKVRALLRRAYPTRRTWILAGPTRSGRGYELIEGPIPAFESSAGNAAGGSRLESHGEQ